MELLQDVSMAIWHLLPFYKVQSFHVENYFSFFLLIFSSFHHYKMETFCNQFLCRKWNAKKAVNLNEQIHKPLKDICGCGIKQLFFYFSWRPSDLQVDKQRILGQNRRKYMVNLWIILLLSSENICIQL